MAYRAVDRHNMMGGRGFRVEQLKIQTFVFRFLALVVTYSYYSYSKAKDTFTNPKVTYSYPMVIFSDPKVTYRDL